MSSRPSQRRDRFEALFNADPDPWDFDTSRYEVEKRAETLSALGNRRFDHALEVGCATGVLTEQLHVVCNRIVGIDIAESALQIARRRLQHLPHISLKQGEVPQDWPTGSFDLIVFSEVLYFLEEREIAHCSSLALEAMPGTGVCLLVNWTGPTDLPVDGDRAVQLFAEAASWQLTSQSRHPQYRIDRFSPA